nr:MAG TPA: hypothetical protein [Myoviridae sp. ct3tv2]
MFPLLTSLTGDLLYFLGIVQRSIAESDKTCRIEYT